MKTSRVVAGALCALLVLGAGWWLLREKPADAQAPAPLRARGPDGPADVPVFRADAETARPTPAALDATDAAVGTGSPGTGASGAEAEASALELTLVHADGNAATGANVVLVLGEAVLGTALTDSAGRARFPAAPGAVVLAIGGVSDVPLAIPLENGRGAHTVELPAGLVISGRVLVDGEPPARPLMLCLSSDEARDADLPGAAWVHMNTSAPGEGWSLQHNAQTVGTDGRFEFSALPPGWTGEFDVTMGLYGRDTDAALHVAAPAHDVVLRLERTRGITGRVVAMDGGAPVPGAAIAWECVSGQATRTSAFDADAEGRFLLPLAWYDDGYDRLTLRIRHPQGLGFRELTVTRANAPPDDDLGDIALQPTRVLAISVRDREGAPVAGAIAVADDASGLRSEPSDAAGLTALEGMLVDTEAMTVWAHRYHALHVALPPPPAPPPAPGAAEQPIVVTLERSPSLDVRATLPDGSVARDTTIVLAARQPLFASVVEEDGNPRFGPHEMVCEVGTSDTNGSVSEPVELDGRKVAAGWVAFRPDAKGAVSVADLLPGVPFELSVWSQAGELAWGPETLELRPEEWRAVEAVLPRMPRDLLVRVRDGQGLPLEGADVDVVPTAHTSGNANWPARLTDAAGLATVKQLHAETADLSVSMDGFATQRLEDAAVARGGLPLDVVLQPERTVRLFVHDASGRGVPADGAYIRQGERSASGDRQPTEDDSGDEQGCSRWLFAKLSDAPAVLTVHVGGRNFELPHDTAVPDADLLVPAPGALRIRWDFPLHDEHDHRLELRRPGDPAEKPSLYWITDKEARGREVLLPVMLPGEVEASLAPDIGGPMPCSGTSRVDVVAGGTAELTLIAP